MTDSALQPVDGKYRCPHCDAINFTAVPPPEVLRCWLCTNSIPREDMLEVVPRKETSQSQGTVFGLTTLMLVVTLVAVSFGLIRSMPGLGVIFLFLLTPALVRAQIKTRRERQAHGQMTKWEEIKSFSTSFAATLGVLVMVSVGVLIAFFGTCIFLLTQF